MNTGQVHPQERSLRPGQIELARLALALGLSLLVHLAGYGIYRGADRFGLLSHLRLPAWVAKTKLLSALVEQREKEKENAKEEPLIYVDVTPQQSVPESPSKADFFSSRSAEAANPRADVDVGIPKIEGTQEDVVRTENVPQSTLKLEPRIAQSGEESKPPPPVGDLAMVKPGPTRTLPVKPEERPRTLSEARKRQGRTQLAGEQMKLDGGVDRLRISPSFDTRQSVFGDYYQLLIEAISQRWFDLLDETKYNYERRGKVVVKFRLNYDGTVSDIQIIENTVDEHVDGINGILCQKAIQDPAPFGRWTRDMRLAWDKDYRYETFAFLFN